jgi:hypothetical protein
MAGMKITPTYAMRARDVSRPRTEHLVAAAEREETVTRHRNGAATAATPSPAANPAPPAAARPIPAPPTGARPAAGGEPTTDRRRRQRER